jgi:hypothetical protein
MLNAGLLLVVACGGKLPVGGVGGFPLPVGGVGGSGLIGAGIL